VEGKSIVNRGEFTVSRRRKGVYNKNSVFSNLRFVLCISAVDLPYWTTKQGNFTLFTAEKSK
jgi:hypothetical protein